MWIWALIGLSRFAAVQGDSPAACFAPALCPVGGSMKYEWVEFDPSRQCGNKYLGGGSDGNPDLSQVRAMVNEKIDEFRTRFENLTDNLSKQITAKMEDFQYKLESLGENIDLLSGQVKNGSQPTDEPDDVICDDDEIAYGNKCYWVVFVAGGTPFSGAASHCVGGGGELGDVLDETHFNKIESLTHDTSPTPLSSTNEYVDIWTGMTLDTQNGAITLSDGTTSSYADWIDGFPTTDSRTNRVLLEIKYDNTKGMWNFSPEHAAKAVLCQK